MKNYAAPVLRISIALVYIWFGLNQIVSPESWVSWLPTYASSLPLSPHDLVLFNGLFEFVFATLLLIGFYTRYVAALIALHALHILTVVGYNDIGIRDFGILMALVSISLQGSDSWTLDSKIASKKQAKISL